MSVRHRCILAVDDASLGVPERSIVFGRTASDDFRISVEHSSGEHADVLVVILRSDVAEVVAFLKQEFDL